MWTASRSKQGSRGVSWQAMVRLGPAAEVRRVSEWYGQLRNGSVGLGMAGRVGLVVERYCIGVLRFGSVVRGLARRGMSRQAWQARSVMERRVMLRWDKDRQAGHFPARRGLVRRGLVWRGRRGPLGCGGAGRVSVCHGMAGFGIAGVEGQGRVGSRRVWP